MRANYVQDAVRIDSLLSSYEAGHGALPGIVDVESRAAFIEQIIDSEQRVRYFEVLQSRRLSEASANPTDDAFDPIKAAILHRDAGDFDEACWLSYLFVHFGKHRRAGWRYVRDIYGSLGGERWTWARTSNDITAFRYWLDENQDELRRTPGPHGFGNHRKYESLKAWTNTGTGQAFESYIDWVHAGGAGHEARFSTFDTTDAEHRFDEIYRSMARVNRLGRIGRFDLIMTLKKLQLVDAAPRHSYLVNATGPLSGARLLLGANGTTLSAREAQAKLAHLSASTGLSPDVMEDAVCNWQKCPTLYVKFSG